MESQSQALFLLRVAVGRRSDVLRCVRRFPGLQQATPAGPRELLVLIAAARASELDRLAYDLASLEGVEAVDTPLRTA